MVIKLRKTNRGGQCKQASVRTPGKYLCKHDTKLVIPTVLIGNSHLQVGKTNEKLMKTNKHI